MPRWPVKTEQEKQAQAVHAKKLKKECKRRWRQGVKAKRKLFKRTSCMMQYAADPSAYMPMCRAYLELLEIEGMGGPLRLRSQLDPNASYTRRSKHR
jgi:hypothetical protein